MVEHLETGGRAVESLRENFGAFDTRHNEQLSLGDFQRAVADGKLPLSKIEVSQLFAENAKEGALHWPSLL